MKAVLIGGSSEEEFAKEIELGLGSNARNGIENNCINLVKKTTLQDLIPVFKSVSLAIGSDSGPMHIAAACDIPVISLWGATSSKRSAPYGSEQYVLNANIGCSPCYKSDCPGLNRLCMREHTVEKILNLYETIE